jgi:hypothetical protein
MRFALLLAVIGSLILGGLSFAADEAPESKGPVYHVVALKFKEGTTAGQIKQVTDAFAELKTRIPRIQTLHWGTNISAEQRNKGFTHCFVLTFTNTKDRDAYLIDPAHKAFGKLAGPMFDDVFVMDLVGQD